MSFFMFSCILLVMSFFSGVIGALTGLGGALVLIPLIVLFLHVNMHYAMGAGLFAVMATSMGTAVAYLKSGYINVRIGMFLEVAAAAGALIGASVTSLLSTKLVQIIFGLVFVVMSYLTWRRKESHGIETKPHRAATWLQLNGCYTENKKEISYFPQNIWFGFSIMGIAGVLSGLLGIGSGTVKVIAMDQVMHLPYKVSTSTSNFIIGITAAVGAGVFLKNGYINPVICFPAVIGVLCGSLIGARLMPILPVKPLRLLFSSLIFLMALQMIYEGFGGVL